MAKAVGLIVSAFVVLALAGSAQCQGFYEIKGRVYCDTCRVLFPTKLSKYLRYAQVELVCRSRENGAETFKVTRKTNRYGYYRLSLSSDHENDICEVRAMGSPDPGCTDPAPEINTAMVSFTDVLGTGSPVRHCNPIGFRSKVALPNCNRTLKEMASFHSIIKS